VSKLAAAVRRFPQRELEIHRLCLRDPEFLTVCEDFADAHTALEYWRAMGASAAARAEEYRALAEELAAAVLVALDRQRCSKQHGGG
jgi:hypothetical protein